MNIASPWRPDRCQIRENPEPGVISAIFDTDHPERPACFFLRPELENADSRFCLVTECPGNTYRCARSADWERQAAMLNGMNDRFVLYDGGKEIHISDALRRHKFTRNSVASAKCGWDYDRYTLSFSPNPRRRQTYRKDDALDELTVLKEALNGRPTEPWAESFAARYLAAHPYPHSRLNLPMDPPPQPPY